MAISTLLKSYSEELLHWIYPLFCPCCNNSVSGNQQGICHSCLQRLPITPYHTIDENPIIQRMYGRLPILYGMSMLRFEKEGSAQQLIHALKYDKRPEIGHSLGLVYGRKIKQQQNRIPFDLIIPVPLHPKKQFKRGYNQSEEFANGLAEGLQIPVLNDVLLRERNARTQTSLSREARWVNVASDYKVQYTKRLKDKHILLVDDVLTTGATLESCGRMLLQACTLHLSIATIALA